MSHPSNIVHCTGPERPARLDRHCLRSATAPATSTCVARSAAATASGTRQIDLVSHRSIRHACPKCDGRGWIETGDDMVPSHDIERSPQGHPVWTVRLDPSDDSG